MGKSVMVVVAVLVGGLLALTVLGGAAVRGGAPTAEAIEEIPPSLLPVYVAAATTCPGLPWQVLAAIGYVESRHGEGRLDPATGNIRPPIVGPPLDGAGGTVRLPDPSMPDGWAHALGPMQFLSTTWDSWARRAPARPRSSGADVHNAWDAIYSAAGYLCGADGRIEDLDEAILSYNGSDPYLQEVLRKASAYGLGVTAGAGGLHCPVAGAVSFTDDWGAPRSGGRIHQGNDLFATHGTPLVAVEAGTITRISNADVGLGGITLWLAGDSGTSYYYAHNALNAVRHGDRVQAGQVVAYVGNTGNAAATPSHVHFQLHPDGGSPTNPYPVLAAVCQPLRAGD